VTLERVFTNEDGIGREPDGRWIGMLRMSGKGVEYLCSALATLQQRGDFDQLGLPDLLNQLIADGHAPQVQYINGHWMDINDLDDLERAGAFDYDD